MKNVIKMRGPCWSLQLFGFLTAVFLQGCGGSDGLAPVEGKVTLDGAPLADVQVLFYQPDAGAERNFIGQTDAEGHFVLTTLRKENKGAAPGSYVVTLTTAFAGPETKETDPIPREKVPPKFQKLKFDVPPEGTAEANFELTSK